MAKAPASGKMNQFCEYGKIENVFTADGHMRRDFEVEGNFWAYRMNAGLSERSNVVRSVDGVDISDDIMTLRTWKGHPVTSDYIIRIGETNYGIVSIAESNDGRMVDYLVIAGLRDAKG